MAHEKSEALATAQLLQKRTELYGNCSPEQRVVIDLHSHKMRLERVKTEVLVWTIRLASAVLVAALIWGSYIRFCPYAAEEQFYTAACKISDTEIPRAVFAECAARNIH